jgi:hypothetical protein
LEAAVEELPAEYGWSIGGGLVILLVIIRGITASVCFCKVKKACCLSSAVKPYISVNHRTREDIIRDSMKEEI